MSEIPGTGPKARRGSTPRIRPAEHEEISRVAKYDPARLGCPFTVWSLAKLRDYLAQQRTSASAARRSASCYVRAGSRFRTKTWKHSTDPDFAVKLAQILALYEQAPADGRVICIDEFGPLNLMPAPARAGTRSAVQSSCGPRSAAPPGFGTCSPLWIWPAGSCSTASGTVNGPTEFGDFLRQVRRRFPTGRLYVVLDNFSPHKKAQIRTWCEANNLELVFTPTNASWLNWIECESTALRYFALNGSDYPDHKTQDAAIGKYVRWRNQRAQPKVTSPSAQNPRTGLPPAFSLTRH